MDNLKLATAIGIAAALAAVAYLFVDAVATGFAASCNPNSSPNDLQRCQIFASGFVEVITAGVVFLLVLLKLTPWARGDGNNRNARDLTSAITAQSEAFRSLANATNTMVSNQQARRSNSHLIIAAVVIVLVVLAVAWLLSSGG